MDCLDRLLASQVPGVIVGEGVSRETIAAAESAIGIEFSPLLFAFLSRYGAAAIGAWEIYGLRNDPRDVTAHRLVRESLAFTRSTGVAAIVVSCDYGECNFVLKPYSASRDDGIIRACNQYDGGECEGWPTGRTFDEFVCDLCNRAASKVAPH